MHQGAEHVKLRPGKEQAAAFPESRRAGGRSPGATTEFNKMEGVTVDREDRKVYRHVADRGGMLANPDDPADQDQAAGAQRGRGLRAHYGDGGEAIAKATRSRASGPRSAWRECLLMGVNLAESDALGNTADPEHIAEPDNLAFRLVWTLFIDEDSGRHINNFMWAFNVDTGKLSRIVPGPAGAGADRPERARRLERLCLRADQPTSGRKPG